MIPIKLTPYSKAVLTAIGGLVTTAISFLVGDGADPATLGAAIMTVLTTFGVYKVTNAPLPGKSSLVEPSTHEVTDNVVALATPKRPKPRSTSKAVSKKTADKAKKVTERRSTSKKDGE